MLLQAKKFRGSTPGHDQMLDWNGDCRKQMRNRGLICFHLISLQIIFPNFLKFIERS